MAADVMNRFGARVAVVYDRKNREHATTLRSVLDSYGVQVEFRLFVQKPHVLSYFAEPHPECSHTIIVCSGDSIDPDPSLVFDVVDQVDGRYDEEDGWVELRLKLTAAEVVRHFRGQGTVLSLAGGSGREALAKAFLQVGYHAYVAPTSFVNGAAALLFAINFMYFLTAGGRNCASTRYSDEASTKKALEVDAGWKYGTGSFSFFATSGDSSLTQ